MKTMELADQVQEAISRVANGAATQYVYSNGKTIRVSNHGANPERTDDNTVSLVVENNGQSYRSDRGRVITSWERSNQWFVDGDGNFEEQFESIDSFLNWFDI